MSNTARLSFAQLRVQFSLTKIGDLENSLRPSSVLVVQFEVEKIARMNIAMATVNFRPTISNIVRATALCVLGVGWVLQTMVIDLSVGTLTSDVGLPIRQVAASI